MKEDILSILEEKEPTFSKGQRQISRYISESYDKAAFMTASRLGSTVGVSESTVVRFAVELGYNGYPEMQKAIAGAAGRGTHLIVSGAYIGTDIEDSIYPVEIEAASRKEASAFAKNVLGYKFVTNQASRRGVINPTVNKVISGMPVLGLVNEMNPVKYCVESPDGIAPVSKAGQVIYRYGDSNISAGVAFEGKGYRCVSYGFPIEALSSEEAINRLIVKTLEYIKK